MLVVRKRMTSMENRLEDLTNWVENTVALQIKHTKAG